MVKQSPRLGDFYLSFRGRLPGIGVHANGTGKYDLGPVGFAHKNFQFLWDPKKPRDDIFIIECLADFH